MPRRTPPRFHALLGMALSAGMLLLAGCTTGPDAPDAPDGPDDRQPVEVGTIDQASYGQGPHEADERVLSDDASWGTFWQEHAERKSGPGVAATPPQVDFESEFVVFVYAGQKNSGGYAMEVTQITFDGAYSAAVTEHAPGNDCITTDALTYPYHLVRVTRADGDDGGTPNVSFDHETNTYSCATAPRDDTDPEPPTPPATPNPLQLDTLHQGSYSAGPDAAEDRAIADHETWAAFWQEHEARNGTTEPRPAPDIDFDRAFILFAYAGEKTSGGHGIHIDDVYRSDGRHTAHVVDSTPGPDCVTTQALTHPYHLVLVNRAAGDDGGTPEVRFDHRATTRAC